MGSLLVLSALILSRSRLVDVWLRRAYSALVSLMAAYGAANLAQDFWHEQVVKRGWTSWDIPSALVPKVLGHVGADRRRDGDPLRARVRAPRRGGSHRRYFGAMTAPRMVFLGFGKYARADKIYALEPLRGDERGDGRRTRVWIEGVEQPLVASRTERTILHDMGHEAGDSALLDGALDLAERLASAAEEGRVDLGDLGRRARRLLAATARPDENEQLF